MDLRDFAIGAGVVVKKLDKETAKEWGGAWSYTEKGTHTTTMGVRTEISCYAAWANETFGKKAASRLNRLIRENAILKLEIRELRERS